MKQLRYGATLCGALLLAAAVVSAQGAPAQGGRQGGGRQGGGAAPAPMTNLQVIPKDTPRAQVIQMMQQFEAALQVDCGHCHVWFGTGLPQNNYASDEKAPKRIAREMLKMVMAANQMVGPAVQTNAQRTAQNVTCAMCHRGKPIPVVEQYAVPGAPAGGARPGGAGAPAGGGQAPGR